MKTGSLTVLNKKNIYIIIMSQGETMILVVAMALGACCCSLSSSGAAMAFVFGKNLFGGGGADKQKLIAYYTDVMERTTNERLKGQIPTIIEAINVVPSSGKDEYWAKMWAQTQSDKDKFYKMAGLA